MRKTLLQVLIALVVVFGVCGYYKTTAYAMASSGGITPSDLIGIDDNEVNELKDIIAEVPEGIFTDAKLEKYEFGYWDYVLKGLNLDYFEEITNLIDKLSDVLGWNVGIGCPEDSCFKIYLKEEKAEELITSNDIWGIFLSANCGMQGYSNWNRMKISNLDFNDYDEITKVIERDESFAVVEANKKTKEGMFTVYIDVVNDLILKGDTLSEIARKRCTTVEKLMELNPQIENPDLIYANSNIRIR